MQILGKVLAVYKKGLSCFSYNRRYRLEKALLTFRLNEHPLELTVCHRNECEANNLAQPVHQREWIRLALSRASQTSLFDHVASLRVLAILQW